MQGESIDIGILIVDFQHVLIHIGNKARKFTYEDGIKFLEDMIERVKRHQDMGDNSRLIADLNGHINTIKLNIIKRT